MNNLWRVGDKEIEYVTQAIRGGLKGDFNAKLEAEFSRKFGTNYAIGVNSGTSALHTALAAMGIKEGDEVIVPPLTFASTGLAAIFLGATPVFADVDPETFNIDPKEMEKKITEKTKAIIPVSLYGLPANFEKITEIAKKHNIKVLEDNAQCFLGSINGKIAGTFGDASIFSFERSKHLTAGGGGMIITNDEEIAEKSRKFSILGYSTMKASLSEQKPKKSVLQSPDFERNVMIAPNYRLPEMSAAVVLAQLERLDHFVEMRIKNAKDYDEAIKGCTFLKAQKIPEGYVNSYFTYAMALDTNKVKWKEFQQKFLENGGESFYAAWLLTYQEPALREKFKDVRCPVAEELQPRLIQLKTNFGTEEKIKEQAEALKKTIEYFEK